MKTGAPGACGLWVCSRCLPGAPRTTTIRPACSARLALFALFSPLPSRLADIRPRTAVERRLGGMPRKQPMTQPATTRDTRDIRSSLSATGIGHGSSPKGRRAQSASAGRSSFFGHGNRKVATYVASSRCFFAIFNFFGIARVLFAVCRTFFFPCFWCGGFWCGGFSPSSPPVLPEVILCVPCH